MPTFKPGRPKEYDPKSKKGEKPPAKPGVYRIKDKKTKKVKYVGETDNLRRRMGQHIASGKLKM